MEGLISRQKLHAIHPTFFTWQESKAVKATLVKLGKLQQRLSMHAAGTPSLTPEKLRQVESEISASEDILAGNAESFPKTVMMFLSGLSQSWRERYFQQYVYVCYNFISTTTSISFTSAGS
jgi:hypothetical protein